MEAPDELQINTVNQQPTNTNADRPKPTCHHCKKPGQHKSRCRLLKNQREQTQDTQNNPGNENTGAKALIQKATSTIITTTTTTKTIKEPRESRKLFSHPVKYVEKQTTPQRNATLEPTQPIDRLPGTEDSKERIRSQREPIKVTLMKLLKL